MASKEEVRALARKAGKGGRLSKNEWATLNRTTSQAGAEGRLVERLIGGSEESD